MQHVRGRKRLERRVPAVPPCAAIAVMKSRPETVRLKPDTTYDWGIADGRSAIADSRFVVSAFRRTVFANSANANAAATDGLLMWTIDSRCVSSYSSACENDPL